MRPKQTGSHRGAYEVNKKRILAKENVCAICGKPVDFSKKAPHPMSPTIDHIIPVAKGGHPSDLNNLQLAHWTCNRQKSDKLFHQSKTKEKKVMENRVLPQSMHWVSYRSPKRGSRNGLNY